MILNLDTISDLERHDFDRTGICSHALSRACDILIRQWPYRLDILPLARLGYRYDNKAL